MNNNHVYALEYSGRHQRSERVLHRAEVGAAALQRGERGGLVRPRERREAEARTVHDLSSS